MYFGSYYLPPALIAAVILLAVLGAILWYAARVSQPQPESVSGPPTGALAMERKIVAIIGMLMATVLLSFGYGLREPDRQVAAQEAQLDVSIGRGVTTFTTLCFGCHGEKGQGAVVPDVEPMRLAPPLNRADLRPTDPDEREKMYQTIFKTIQRGRPGTPMPPWGVTDAGTLLDEHIDELTLMILNGDRNIRFEGTTGTPWQHTDHVVHEHIEEGVTTLPQQPQVDQLPFYQALSPQEQQGVRVILQRGCGSCHVIPNIPGASGTIGPSLGANPAATPPLPVIGQRNPIAGGAVPNTSQADLARWIMDPQVLKPGTAMPDLGLSEEESAAAAAYLYTIQP
jgi:mono/diheme cytochrome c family protein/cytochrome c2